MQKTAYEMRISYGSSDVCSSDLYVDPDLDHGGRDQDADLARLETRHDVVLFGTLHPAVDEPDAAGAQSFAPQCRAVFGRSQLASLALGDERAPPIGRSEERRGEKDVVSPCRSCWSPAH